MLAQKHQKLTDFIWNVANKLRGRFRPPQYHKVMLPMIVLRRLDCVLESTKDAVLAEHERLKAAWRSAEVTGKLLSKHRHKAG